MDFDIINYTYLALESINESLIVREGWYDESLNKTHITFFLMQDLDSDFAEDMNYSEDYMVQVDIWGKSSNESRQLKKEIKKAMRNNGYLYDSGQDLFETDTKLFHKALRFNYTNNL